MLKVDDVVNCISDALEIKMTPDKGRGVFAIEDITEG